MTAGDVLREALDNTPGWRIRARRVLGIADDIQCPICERWFDKHRSAHGKTCGRISCQNTYRRRHNSNRHRVKGQQNR